MRSSTVAVVACFLFAAASVATAANTQNTLSDPRIQTTACKGQYDTLMSTYYGTDQTCKDLIFRALNTTVQSQCPPTSVGSPVHLCMNKNGTASNIAAWTAFIKSCEVMYIPDRMGAGEAESTFTYIDNSCFQVFESFGQFQSWLNDASKYRSSTTTGTTGSAGSSVRLGFKTLIAAILFAAFVLW